MRRGREGHASLRVREGASPPGRGAVPLGRGAYARGDHVSHADGQGAPCKLLCLAFRDAFSFVPCPGFFLRLSRNIFIIPSVI